ncbi:hypothetical protein SAMN02982931_04750, partial [Bauldia litoralis]
MPQETPGTERADNIDVGILKPEFLPNGELVARVGDEILVPSDVLPDRLQPYPG